MRGYQGRSKPKETGGKTKHMQWQPQAADVIQGVLTSKSLAWGEGKQRDW